MTLADINKNPNYQKSSNSINPLLFSIIIDIMESFIKFDEDKYDDTEEN